MTLLATTSAESSFDKDYPFPGTLDFSVFVKDNNNTEILANELSCFRLAGETVIKESHESYIPKRVSKPQRKALGEIPMVKYFGTENDIPLLIEPSISMTNCDTRPLSFYQEANVNTVKSDHKPSDKIMDQDLPFKFPFTSNELEDVKTADTVDNTFFNLKGDADITTFAPNSNSTILADKFQRLSLVYRQNRIASYPPSKNVPSSLLTSIPELHTNNDQFCHAATRPLLKTPTTVNHMADNFLGDIKKEF